jgi:N-acetylglucosaminyl-diphospho-decaprenol L-rhamnosyltransferase
VSLGERVGLVVTTHEGPGPRLQRCLAAIAAADADVAVVVVDNSGSEASLTDAPCANIEHVRVDNRGFGAAANVGFAHPAVADAELIGLLNDDVVVGDAWLRPLVECLDAEPAVAAVQPMLVLADTDPPLVNSLGVELDRFGAGSDIGYRTAESEVADRGPRRVDMVTGGALLLRQTFLDDVGGFDERLFLYYEDVDLCRRGSELGWKFRCVPASRVEHEMGASTGDLGDDRTFLQERNRLVTAARFGSAALIGRAMWLSIKRLRHEPRRAHRHAFLHGIARMPRALYERGVVTWSRR